MFNLKDKKIVVTGASRGLGSICAKALAQEGAHLVLLARSKDQLEEVQHSCQSPENHMVIAADLTEPNELKKAIEQAQEFSAYFDVILHVAGAGLGLRDPLLSSEDLYKLFMLNVGVAAEINRFLVPGMTERTSGNVVHVCSIASSEATGSVGYNTVKAGLAGYVRTLGRELAKSKVVVTGILPGGFYAPGNPWDRHSKNNPKMVQDFIQNRLPRGFMGKAEEVVPLLLFLCSPLASMMGGCLVPIDAGEGVNYLEQ